MSYLALARKWRPSRFEDVRGQGHVVRALSHALNRDQLHPAILLTGTRGVGKTTLARIVAKSLNCETGVTASPCGACSACREVGEGRFIDLLEIDAASNTGVDNVRELIDNAQYSPARGRYKVYLIDEVHMLSKPAFNALLKTLEEPPSHVKFILATTDPQKLLPTVLSRCLQFNLKRLPQSLIRESFAEILQQEKVEFEFGALAEVARAADGSMRDGLSLLDQAIAFAGGGSLTRTLVEDMLGTSGRRTLFELVAALAQADGEKLLASLRRLEEAAPDYGALLNDLAGILQRLAVLQVLPAAADADDDPALEPLARLLAAEDVQMYYQIAVLGRRDLPFAPDPRLGFEMTALRMFAFRPVSPSRGPAAPASGGGTAAPRSRDPGALVAAATPQVGSAVADAVAPKPAAPPPPAGSAPSPQAALSGGMPAADWSNRIDALGLDEMTRQLARHCAWIDRADGVVRMALDDSARHLLTDERRAAIEKALRSAGPPDLVQIEVGARPDCLSPAVAEERRLIERQREAERAIHSDPVVQAIKEAFGASVRPGSVHPRD